MSARRDETPLSAAAPQASEPPELGVPPLTAQPRPDGWHDSQLGRTRRMSSPVEDDDVGQALHDFDPFV